MRPKRDQRSYNRSYYAANRQREIDRVRVRQRATVRFLRALRDVPCFDCHKRFLPHQMDFDHREPALRSFNICGGAASLKSRVALLAEIAKCDVVCANCHRVRTRNHHRARLALRHAAGSRPAKRPDKRRIWQWHQDMLDQLRDVPCLDCGGRFAPCAMEFDHRDPATKAQAVTRMIGRASMERILAEVDKCDIVCSNCHRVRTFDRRSPAAA